MTELCVIILNYNGFQETKEFVDSLTAWEQEKLPFQAIVVDNCSTDNSFEQLKDAFSAAECVDVIRSEKNGGYSYGNNYGAKYAIEKYSPEFLAIANPDIQVDQDTMLELLKGFSADPNIAMTSPVMKDTRGGYKVYTQRLPQFSDDIRACWTEKSPSSIITEGYETIPGHTNMILTEMLPGSFFVVRSSCFQEAGMLDEGVFLFCEERIIGKRMKDLDYKLVLRSDLFYVHAHSVTIKKAMDTYKTWKTIWQSRIYYQQEYNKAGMVSITALRFAAWCFLKSLSVKSKLYEWKHSKSVQ